MDPCCAVQLSEKGQGEGRPFQGQRVEVASQPERRRKEERKPKPSFAG